MGRLLDLDRHQYDSDKSEKYLSNYDRWFGHLHDRPLVLLELGIQRGGSLQMWRDAYPEATVIGLDLNPCTVADNSGRIHTYQGFQQDVALLDRIAATHAPNGFDVVIDDASHLGTFTAQSFWHLFPRHVKAGGLYVLEDWSCAYWESWSDGRSFRDSGQQPEDVTLRMAAQRRLRTMGRPVASRLRSVPVVRERLERAFVRLERSLVETRFPSHDYGMAGVVKQLVDVVAAPVMARDPGALPPPAVIDRMEVMSSQVLLVRSGFRAR